MRSSPVGAAERQSPDQRGREEDDSISLDIEAQHRMATGALRIHQYEFARSPPDLPQEAAEHIESLLPLQLPNVDIEIDFIAGMESEDRQNIGSRQTRRFGHSASAGRDSTIGR